MKFTSKLVWLFAGLALPVLGFAQSAPSANAGRSALSHVIPVRILASGFARGYGLSVTRVVGDRGQLEPGGTYLVEGDFHVDAGQSARLVAMRTPPFAEPFAPAPIAPVQTALLHGGQGHYSLIATMDGDGALSVCLFNPGVKLTGADISNTRVLGQLRLFDVHQLALVREGMWEDTQWTTANYTEIYPCRPIVQNSTPLVVPCVQVQSCAQDRPCAPVQVCSKR